MGYDMDCYVEQRVDGKWLLCTREGKIFNATLTDGITIPDSYTAEFDLLTKGIDDECLIDIPRNHTLYAFLLGWQPPYNEGINSGETLIYPQFDRDIKMIETSAAIQIYKEADQNYLHQLTLAQIDYLGLDEVEVYYEDGTTEILTQDYHYEPMREFVEVMRKVRAEPQDIRVIMRHEH